MLKTINDLISKPAPWMYFILVVALLIIVTRNSGTINDLQADLEGVSAEISTLEALNETTLDAMANEVAVRDDAIAGLNDAIAGWEADSVDVNTRLNQVDAERVDLEVQVVDLTARLDASASALDASTLALTDAIANPICSACPECPVVTE